MNYRVVGTCGNCGGRVIVPTVWWEIYPPTPSCESCGATPANAHGPVIPMNPSPKQGRKPCWERGQSVQKPVRGRTFFAATIENSGPPPWFRPQSRA